MITLSGIERDPKITMTETTLLNTSPYEPQYEDAAQVEDVVSRLQEIPPVTSVENIQRLSDDLEEAHEGDAVIVTAGRCTNKVMLYSQPDEYQHNIIEQTKESALLYQTVKQIMSKAFGKVVTTLRDGRGQSIKPRTNPTELAEGEEVEVFRGEGVNSLNPRQRSPDPDRLLSMGMQACDVEERLTEEVGQHVYHEHETLVTMYDEAFVETIDGKRYLLSADRVWAGERTNDPDDSPQIDFIKSIENPRAVKIGPETTAIDIRNLAETLNPTDKPGHLTFVLRIGLDNIHKAEMIIDAIVKHAPGALIVCDPMHGKGNTKTVKLENSGESAKTRVVDDIVKEVQIMGILCKQRGTRLHGVHLEAMGTDDIKECVDHEGEIPPDKSDVDPNLNLSQLRRVLKETLAYL